MPIRRLFDSGGMRATVRRRFTGDGSGFLGGSDGSGRRSFGHMYWSEWNRRQATGHGAVSPDDRTPDCAGGTFHPYVVTAAGFGIAAWPTGLAGP